MVALLDKADIEFRLATTRFGHVLRILPETGSTNADALAWATQGGPEGAVIVAERQTAGRGRFDRVWESSPGENLTFSIILRPRLAPEAFGMIGIAAAVAVADGLQHLAPGTAPRIKWPNDILLGGRKCCGILPESRMTAGEPRPTVALGIGVNVNQVAFSEEIRSRATSLYLETGKQVDRNDLIVRLLVELERIYDILWRGASGSIRARYMERLLGLQEEVTLHTARDGTPVVGRLVGINEFGALRLHMAQEERTFHAGELTFRSRV